MPLSKGFSVGPYVILEHLKSGGMGDIYRARQKDGRSEVALKISKVNAQNTNALRQEVDLLNSLKHPGIVKVLSIPLQGQKDQVYYARAHNLPGQPWYYSMEMLHGGSLSMLLKQYRSLPIEFASAIGMKLCDILEYIHMNNLVHLDVKPDNILFRMPLRKQQLFEPVLIDFGVASRASQTGVSGGTTAFMPPEYIRKMRGELASELSFDVEKVDIYSLGVVIYRMWTGEYPFGGLSVKALTSNILSQSIRPPCTVNPALPPRCDQLIAGWLSKDPYDRPGLREIRQELNYLSRGQEYFPANIKPTQGNSKAWWQFWK